MGNDIILLRTMVMIDVHVALVDYVMNRNEGLQAKLIYAVKLDVDTRRNDEFCVTRLLETPIVHYSTANRMADSSGTCK